MLLRSIVIYLLLIITNLSYAAKVLQPTDPIPSKQEIIPEAEKIDNSDPEEIIDENSDELE